MAALNDFIVVDTLVVPTQFGQYLGVEFIDRVVHLVRTVLRLLLTLHSIPVYR